MKLWQTTDSIIFIQIWIEEKVENKVRTSTKVLMGKELLSRNLTKTQT
jgi:hypothetical protein